MKFKFILLSIAVLLLLSCSEELDISEFSDDFSEYETDWDQLAKEIQKTRGGELPKRAYMHKKLFDQHLKELKAKSVSLRVDELHKPEDTPVDTQISDGIKDLFK